MGGLARALLHIAVVTMLCATLGGCFPSPIAVVDQNTPPEFILDYTQPKDSEFDVATTPAGGDSPTTTFVLRVHDPDPEPVYVRFFVDPIRYEDLDPFGLGTTELSASADGDRDRQFPVTGFCDGLGTLTTHTFEAWVADTPFQDTAPYNEVQNDPETGRKGNRDVIKWLIRCVLPAGG